MVFDNLIPFVFKKNKNTVQLNIFHWFPISKGGVNGCWCEAKLSTRNHEILKFKFLC